MVEGLVSIIVPVYNSEQYIEQTIACVQAQTYLKWEMLLVDDCSTDSSASIIKKMAERDSRLKYIPLQQNSGAAVARNTALKNANGQFIAYLDADDIWFPTKLERQLNFLKDNPHVGFSCCDYRKIDADGSDLNKIVHMPKTMTYSQYLKNTIIQTVGVIINLNVIDRALLEMPNIRRRQDAATWAQILKAGNLFYGQNEVLAAYRRVSGSLSSNKLRAARLTWEWFRKIERLNFFYACWCYIGYAFNAVRKRLYFKSNKKGENLEVQDESTTVN